MQIPPEPVDLSSGDHPHCEQHGPEKRSEGEGTATRGRKVDCLASGMDQTCCSINSILRGTAARERAVKCPRTRYPQSPDWRPNREGTVSLPASGGEGAGGAVWCTQVNA